MNKINLFTYVIANYKIIDLEAEVYFAPAVLDALFSKKALINLSNDNQYEKEALDGIVRVIKGQVEKYNTYEVWYDLIEYNGIELVWKSKFIKEKKTMYVEILHSRGNCLEKQTIH